MLVRIPQVLDRVQVAHARAVLEAADWVDGRATAGEQSARVKHNLQVPAEAPKARALGETILQALGRNETFIAAGLPLRVFPPLFNRYDAGMGFGAHVDNAIRFAGPVRFRIDLSMTLFLTEPEAYGGGELLIADSYGEHAVKLAAGDMVLYPAESLHRVVPVTSGSRWASFFWAQSMVRDKTRRAHLFDLDTAIRSLSARIGQDDAAVVSLAAGYHNLLRMWAET